MCSFRSLKQARSQQGGQAYGVGVMKGGRKIREESDERGCTEEKAKQNTCHKLI